MKKFALIAGNKVQNIIVAEDLSKVGPSAMSFICIDITDANPAPSIGWTWSRTSGFKIEVPSGMESLLTNDVLVLEPSTPSAPKTSSSSKKKDKSTEETPAEE